MKDKEELNGVLNRRVLGLRGELDKLLGQVDMQKDEWERERISLLEKADTNELKFLTVES